MARILAEVDSDLAAAQASIIALKKDNNGLRNTLSQLVLTIQSQLNTSDKTVTALAAAFTGLDDGFEALVLPVSITDTPGLFLASYDATTGTFVRASIDVFAILTGLHGEQWLHSQVTEEITLDTAAVFTDSSADLLPADSIIEAVVARITTTIPSTGPIDTFGITSGGLGYAPGDTGTITTGDSTATYIVNHTDGGGDTNSPGVITDVSITAAGTGYSVGTGQTTAIGGAQPGTGDETFTLDVLTVIEPTTWSIGDAGTADRFNTDTNLTAGQQEIGLDHWSSSPIQVVQGSASPLRITLDQIPDAGVIRITTFYRQFTAPTS